MWIFTRQARAPDNSQDVSWTWDSMSLLTSCTFICMYVFIFMDTHLVYSFPTCRNILIPKELYKFMEMTGEYIKTRSVLEKMGQMVVGH